MVDFDDDLLVYCMEAFAEPVIYLPVDGGDAADVRGIFDRNRTVVAATDHGQFTSTTPTLGVRKTDFPDGTKFRIGDQFVIDGRLWDVVDVEDESADGHRVLRLHDQGPYEDND